MNEKKLKKLNKIEISTVDNGYSLFLESSEKEKEDSIPKTKFTNLVFSNSSVLKEELINIIDDFGEPDGRYS